MSAAGVAHVKQRHRMTEPAVTPWAKSCRALRHQKRNEKRVNNSWRIRSIAAALSSPALHDQAVSTLLAVAASMQSDLVRRGALCNAAMPCHVSVNATSPSLVLRVCLPTAMGDARLCEPWGERWQRIGAPVGRFCVNFDVSTLGMWYAERHTRPAFFRAEATDAEMALLLQQKLLPQGRFSRSLWENATDQMVAEKRAYRRRQDEDLRAVLRLSAARDSREWARPRRHAVCAVVGSGHDLRCGSKRG